MLHQVLPCSELVVVGCILAEDTATVLAGGKETMLAEGTEMKSPCSSRWHFLDCPEDHRMEELHLVQHTDQIQPLFITSYQYTYLLRLWRAWRTSGVDPDALWWVLPRIDVEPSVVAARGKQDQEHSSSLFKDDRPGIPLRNPTVCNVVSNSVPKPEHTELTR